MATPKDPDLEKKTLNFREGDFDKIKELFPKKKPSIAIREIISAFVDRHYRSAEIPEASNIEL